MTFSSELRQLCVPRLFSLKEERSGCNAVSYCSSHRTQQQPLTTWYEACPASQPGAHLCWDTAGPGQELQTAWGSSCCVCWVTLQTRVCLGPGPALLAWLLLPVVSVQLLSGVTLVVLRSGERKPASFSAEICRGDIVSFYPVVGFVLFLFFVE